MMFSLFHKLIWSPLEKELNKIPNKKSNYIFVCNITCFYFFSSFMIFFIIHFTSQFGHPKKKKKTNKNPLKKTHYQRLQTNSFINIEYFLKP